jgi:hypothetical protein
MGSLRGCFADVGGAFLEVGFRIDGLLEELSDCHGQVSQREIACMMQCSPWARIVRALSCKSAPCSVVPDFSRSDATLLRSPDCLLAWGKGDSRWKIYIQDVSCHIKCNQAHGVANGVHPERSGCGVLLICHSGLSKDRPSTKLSVLPAQISMGVAAWSTVGSQGAFIRFMFSSHRNYPALGPRCESRTLETIRIPPPPLLKRQNLAKIHPFSSPYNAASSGNSLSAIGKAKPAPTVWFRSCKWSA